MAHHSASPQQQYSPLTIDIDDLPPVMQSRDQPTSPSSSDDDDIIPPRQRRPQRAPIPESTSTTPHDPLAHHHDLRNPTTSAPNPSPSLLSQRRAAHQAEEASKKRPGPRAWASKPIKKNDLVAKAQVIAEIEKIWGKNFIKTFIPKCHRPLVKRGKAGKRAIYRDHETDPMKWLPSVLKSLLGIAQLTRDRKWLGKAMGDVVRYRIRHTGNRKPQLVTTDFDVLEDMLVKDWDVEYSFGIRYKHLLVKGLGRGEADEDVEHILGGGVGDEDEGSGEEGGGGRDYGGGGGYGTETHQAPQCNQPPRQQTALSPAQSMHDGKHGKSTKHSSLRQTYPTPYPYGPTLDPWGRPMSSYPTNTPGYNYPNYPPYNYDNNYPHSSFGYPAPPPDSHSHSHNSAGASARQPSHPPDHPTTYPYAYPHARYDPTPAPSQASLSSPLSRNHTLDDVRGGAKGGRGDSGSVERASFPHYAGATAATAGGGGSYSHPFHSPAEYTEHNDHPFNPRASQCVFVPEDAGLDAEQGVVQSASKMDGEENGKENAEEDRMRRRGDTPPGERDWKTAALEAELRATELEAKVQRLYAKRAVMMQAQGLGEKQGVD